MLESLEIPLDKVEEGPVRECFEILRRWTEDVVKIQEGTLASFGLKTDFQEGTLQPSEIRYIKTPNNGFLVGAHGMTQSLDASSERWIPMVTTSGGTRIIMQVSLYTTDNVLLRNDGANALQYKILLIYKG